MTRQPVSESREERIGAILQNEVMNMELPPRHDTSDPKSWFTHCIIAERMATSPSRCQTELNAAVDEVHYRLPRRHETVSSVGRHLPVLHSLSDAAYDTELRTREA